jgi:hypothetical protein
MPLPAAARLLSLTAAASREGPLSPAPHKNPQTKTTAITLALLACSACASGASAGVVPVWGKKTVSAAAADAASSASPTGPALNGDLSYVGKPCPTRAEPPPQEALRLPDDVPGALVAAVELTLLDGTKQTITRDAVASGERSPVAIAGATRYGGAPLSLGADVKPNEVAAATVLLRGGKRVELSIPERAAAVAASDPEGCWKPRKTGPRRAGATWNGFDLKAKRILPPVVAVADPNAVRTWAVGAQGHPWVEALMASKKQAAMEALSVGAGVDVGLEDGSVETTGAAAAGASGDALGDFLQPVFAGGR